MGISFTGIIDYESEFFLKSGRKQYQKYTKVRCALVVQCPRWRFWDFHVHFSRKVNDHIFSNWISAPLKRLNLTNKIIVKSEKFEYFDSDIDFKRHLKGTEKGQSEKDSCWKRWTAYKNPKIPFSERHGCSRIHWIVKEKVILEMLHIQGRAMDLIIPGAPFFPAEIS